MIASTFEQSTAPLPFKAPLIPNNGGDGRRFNAEQSFWTKTSGLYPSYEDIDTSLSQHDWNAAAEYGEAQHELMKHIFESKCDAQAMKDAADIIGSGGNTQAMHGCFYAFMHAAGMAYQKSGMAGAPASIALGCIRFKLTQGWDNVNGFSLHNMQRIEPWSEA